MLATSANLLDCAQPPSGSIQYSPENTTSCAVNAEPSDHFMPGVIFQVIDIRSALTPPFATVGISVTSHAVNSPS